MLRSMVILGTALAVAACGQSGSKVQYHANGGQTVTIADPKNGTITAQIGPTAAMPSDLPSWTPAYPGSTVAVSQNHTGGTAGGAFENVMLQSPDDLPKVTAFYDGQIARAGLKPMQSVTSPEVSIRMVETSSGMISVNVSKADEGGSTISISFMPKG